MKPLSANKRATAASCDFMNRFKEKELEGGRGFYETMLFQREPADPSKSARMAAAVSSSVSTASALLAMIFAPRAMRGWTDGDVQAARNSRVCPATYVPLEMSSLG